MLVLAQAAIIGFVVLFLHDGGLYDDESVEQAVRDAVDDPIFWQFVGLGDSDYGILERLDTLTDRRVDNTGFFALDDIDQVDDRDLYSRLLGELPSWVRAYYPPGSPVVAGLGTR